MGTGTGAYPPQASTHKNAATRDVLSSTNANGCKAQKGDFALRTCSQHDFAPAEREFLEAEGIFRFFFHCF